MKNEKQVTSKNDNKKGNSEWKQTLENVGNGLAEVGKVALGFAGVIAFAALGDHLREKRERMEEED